MYRAPTVMNGLREDVQRRGNQFRCGAEQLDRPVHVDFLASPDPHHKGAVALERRNRQVVKTDLPGRRVAFERRLSADCLHDFEMTFHPKLGEEQPPHPIVGGEIVRSEGVDLAVHQPQLLKRCVHRVVVLKRQQRQQNVARLSQERRIPQAIPDLIGMAQHVFRSPREVVLRRAGFNNGH